MWILKCIKIVIIFAQRSLGFFMPWLSIVLDNIVTLMDLCISLSTKLYVQRKQDLNGIFYISFRM